MGKNRSTDVEKRISENKQLLRRRLKKHGSRGFVKVVSSEGASVTTEAAKNLVPAG